MMADISWSRVTPPCHQTWSQNPLKPSFGSGIFQPDMFEDRKKMPLHWNWGIAYFQTSLYTIAWCNIISTSTFMAKKNKRFYPTRLWHVNNLLKIASLPCQSLVKDFYWGAQQNCGRFTYQDGVPWPSAPWPAPASWLFGGIVAAKTSKLIGQLWTV